MPVEQKYHTDIEKVYACQGTTCTVVDQKYTFDTTLTYDDKKWKVLRSTSDVIHRKSCPNWSSIENKY